MILDEKLDAGDIIVLDGAIGSEIERVGGAMHPNSWCGVATKTHPDIVRQVHESYVEAGCDIVTANTFATCRHVLEGAGLADETVAINRRAIELAREAIENTNPDRPIAIAGSLSNHVAWHPGSVAADPKFLPSPEQETANYREVAETLAEAGCDLLLLEMMQDLHHSARLAEVAAETGLPVWTGISTSRGPNGQMVGWDQYAEEDGNLPEGHKQAPREPLEAIIETLIEFEPQAVGIMHSSYMSMAPGLEVLFNCWDGPVMAYPESIGFDAVTRTRYPSGPNEFAQHCGQLVESGVQIIGGCCGSTVHHIRAMVECLPDNVGARSKAA